MLGLGDNPEATGAVWATAVCGGLLVILALRVWLKDRRRKDGDGPRRR